MTTSDALKAERWLNCCACENGPWDDEVVYDRNLTPRCPRCDMALGGDPVEVVDTRLTPPPVLLDEVAEIQDKLFHERLGTRPPEGSSRPISIELLDELDGLLTRIKERHAPSQS